jgi:hypothetical protein
VRKLIKEVKDKTGVMLKVKYLSYSSSKDEFDANGITIGEATKDPVILFGKLWISSASKALEPTAVQRLCDLVKQSEEFK